MARISHSRFVFLLTPIVAAAAVAARPAKTVMQKMQQSSAADMTKTISALAPVFFISIFRGHLTSSYVELTATIPRRAVII